MKNMSNLSIFRANDNALQEIPECVEGWVSVMDLQVSERPNPNPS
jgi:hypothetical protein|tara:strand:+ start:574 stop:708 length:135 start_codon:yes stop_codon:yes gene_type:complete